METDNTPLTIATPPGDAGPEPALTGTDRPRPTTPATRSDKHTLTTREVMHMFEAAGVPRNQRTIERYCKGGDLDCIVDGLEKRYYITQESAEILIGQLQEIALRHQRIGTHGAAPLAPAADDIPHPTATATHDGAEVKQGTPDKHGEKHGIGEYEQQLAVMEARIKELENEKFNLEIDKRSREQIIGMMREQMALELKTFTAEITRQSRRVGELETEMRQLKAPDRGRPPVPDGRRRLFDDGAAIDAEYRDADGPTDAPHPDVSLHEQP